MEPQKEGMQLQNVPNASTLRTKPSGQVSNVDMFMKITGFRQGVIKGESVDTKHPGEIEVESFSWDILQPYDKTGSGLASGKRQLGQFRFSMKSQVATPHLLQACSEGEHLKTAVLTCRKAGGQQQEYMKWTISNAMVATVKTGCVGGEDILPHDEVCLVFRQIQLDYREQKPDGTLGGAVTFLDEWNTTS
jgi:type VI secretion system secreted protein Hcp